MTLRVGTAVAQPGAFVRGHLELGETPDGPVVAPVILACGARPGPILWVQGCVHGGEVQGPAGLLTFLDSLGLEELAGTLVALPVANPIAFRGLSRVSPVDQGNLNRAFPGREGGSHTEDLAGRLFQTALAVADAAVDLHSGGERSHVPFYALYWDDGSPASRESARLARCAGTPDIWASRDRWLEGALFTHFVRQGKPAVLVETGGGGPVLPQDVANFVTAITGIARALGMLPGEPPRQPGYTVIGECTLVYCRRGGLFVPACAPGDILEEGDSYGRVVNLHGETVEVVRPPFYPAYAAAVRRAWMPCYSGDFIGEAVTVLERRR